MPQKSGGLYLIASIFPNWAGCLALYIQPTGGPHRSVKLFAVTAGIARVPRPSDWPDPWLPAIGAAGGVAPR